jgi:transposase InsO family protein
MAVETAIGSHERWAHLRFSVVGPLLASPPAGGELQAELRKLSERVWLHPVTGQTVRFGASTIERWYYAARAAADPVRILRRKPRKDSGEQRVIGVELGAALRRQYAAYPGWSYKLHLDNLAVLVEQKPGLGPLPSYASLRRYLVSHGLLRRRRKPVGERRAGERRPTEHREPREVRSYETEYVSGLWHLDFHHGSQKILTPAGEWVQPILLAILDDRSRLVCHIQWYLNETAECLIHGLSQAMLKRGLPRALLTDNGSAMIATETTQGLGRLSILHQTTLPYSPHQNGKQEVFWGQVEGRLLAMLERQPDLSLALLNEATQAWVELEYHRAIHSETEQTPLGRWLDGPSVGRECPSVDALRLAFTATQTRTQRTSDGTISIAGTRYEIPARFRHLLRVEIRCTSWDRRCAWLMDEKAGVVLERLYPLDRTRNADAVRRSLPTSPPSTAAACEPPGIAPLLRQLMAEYAATGLPPAYIPKEDP